MTHEEFVRELKKEISLLDLFHLPTTKYLCRGFKPDIIVCVGAQSNDVVYIDAINTRESLNRDVGALLKLKANLDRDGVLYREVLGVYSDRIDNKNISEFEALVDRTPKFYLKVRKSDILYWCIDRSKRVSVRHMK